MRSLDSIKKKLEEWRKGLTPATFLGRRSYAQILYTPVGETESQDISEDMMKYLLSIEFTDNLSGQVDDITFTLEDRAQLWQDTWYPEPGSKIALSLFTLNQHSVTEGLKQLDLGEYEVDEIEISGMPTTVQIKAVNAVSDSDLRGVKKNRTWENISIWKIASDIAKENGMRVDYEPGAENNPSFSHVEQSDQSDLEFLKKLCDDSGLDLKISTQTIIIIDEAQVEAGEPLIVFWRPGTASFSAQTDDEEVSPDNPLNFVDFLSYSMKAKTRDTYKACHVKYKKGKDKSVIEGWFTAPDKEKGQILEVNEQVDSVEAAEKLAKKKLREQNRDEKTADFTLPGDFHFMAGILVQLQNFGAWDGKYIITQAKHSLGSGYGLSLEMRKCLDGY